MVFRTTEFLEHTALDLETLEVWIEEEWIIPSGNEAERLFSEGDLARAHFIRDLMNELGVNSEGVSVVLHLVDQVHGLRRALSELAGPESTLKT